MNFLKKAHNVQASISFSVKAVPTEQNGYIGIVEGSIYDEHGSITDFSTADAVSSDSTRPEDILNKAKESVAELLLQRAQPTYPSPAQHQAFPSPTKQDKAKSNGGGTKPASDKQKEVIISKCEKLRKNPDDICQNVCGKPLHKLRGQDAHEVIQSLIH